MSKELMGSLLLCCGSYRRSKYGTKQWPKIALTRFYMEHRHFVLFPPISFSIIFFDLRFSPPQFPSIEPHCPHSPKRKTPLLAPTTPGSGNGDDDVKRRRKRKWCDVTRLRRWRRWSRSRRDSACTSGRRPVRPSGARLRSREAAPGNWSPDTARKQTKRIRSQLHTLVTTPAACLPAPMYIYAHCFVCRFYLLFQLHIICYPALGPQGCY